jgi:DNA-directed RNA polymerase subunit RPC12/RpoP
MPACSCEPHRSSQWDDCVECAEDASSYHQPIMCWYCGSWICSSYNRHFIVEEEGSRRERIRCLRCVVVHHRLVYGAHSCPPDNFLRNEFPYNLLVKQHSL